VLDSGPGFKSQPRRCWVKVDRRIRWHYTTTILLLCIGARLTRYRNCKFQNGCRTISRHADGISRYSVPPSAGPLLPLLRQTVQTYHASVHQAAKWVAALLRVARVTAGLAESSGIYRVGQKNRTVFRLDNFVTVIPIKACSMSKFSKFYREKWYKTRISMSLNILGQICSNRHNS